LKVNKDAENLKRGNKNREKSEILGLLCDIGSLVKVFVELLRRGTKSHQSGREELITFILGYIS
jgi:hypothetical protein